MDGLPPWQVGAILIDTGIAGTIGQLRLNAGGSIDDDGHLLWMLIALGFGGAPGTLPLAIRGELLWRCSSGVTESPLAQFQKGSAIGERRLRPTIGGG